MLNPDDDIFRGMNKKSTSCSIRDLAGYVGLSTCTVSKVLNNRPGFKILDSTRQRVLEAARELNYVPNINAKRLFERKSGVIALVVPSTTEGDKVFSDNHFVNIMTGMEPALAEYGYSLLLKFNDKTTRDEARYLEILRNGSVDGLLIWGAHRSDGACYRALAENNAPHLFLTSLPDEGKERAPFNYVCSDYQSAAEQLTRRLTENGCRNLLYLAGFEDSSVVQSMTAGIRQAVTPGELKLTTSFGPYSYSEARQRALRLLRQDVYDGIIAVSTRVAAGAVDAMQELNIPAGEIRLVILDSSSRPLPFPGERGIAVTEDKEIGRAAMAGIAALIERRAEQVQMKIAPNIY